MSGLIAFPELLGHLNAHAIPLNSVVSLRLRFLSLTQVIRAYEDGPNQASADHLAEAGILVWDRVVDCVGCNRVRIVTSGVEEEKEGMSRSCSYQKVGRRVRSGVSRTGLIELKTY